MEQQFDITLPPTLSQMKKKYYYKKPGDFFGGESFKQEISLCIPLSRRGLNSGYIALGVKYLSPQSLAFLAHHFCACHLTCPAHVFAVGGGHEP